MPFGAWAKWYLPTNRAGPLRPANQIVWRNGYVVNGSTVINKGADDHGPYSYTIYQS